jgi:hypothetical protein
MVNLPANKIQILIDCKSIAEMPRNQIVYVKIRSIFLESIHTLTSMDNNRANTLEVLYSTDIS